MSDLRFLIFFKFTFIELFCIQVLSKDIKKGRSLGMIEIKDVNKTNIGIFSNVLVEAARNLDKLGMKVMKKVYRFNAEQYIFLWEAE